MVGLATARCVASSPEQLTWQIRGRHGSHVNLAWFLNHLTHSPIFIFVVLCICLRRFSSLGHSRILVRGLLLLLTMLQSIMMTLERFVTEPRADLADSLVRLRLIVETCKVKRAIHARAFARPKIGADDDQIERITHASEVIFLELGATTSQKCRVSKIGGKNERARSRRRGC